jgi:hypothetical protein
MIEIQNTGISNSAIDTFSILLYPGYINLVSFPGRNTASLGTNPANNFICLVPTSLSFTLFYFILVHFTIPAPR